jgi:hypothetical protein
MDVFERVREVNTGVGLTDERIAGARARLLEGIDTGMATARKRVSRRPMFLIAGAVAGVAAATATVMVVGQLTAPAPQVEAIPAPTVDPRQPGEVLPHPAPTGGTGITEPFPGTTPQPGQYLSIQAVSDALTYRGPYASIFAWSYRPDEYPPISAALLRSTHQSFMPADRSGEWVFQDGPLNERLEFYSNDPGPGNQVAWDNMLPVLPPYEPWSSLGGYPSDGGIVSGTLESYAALPSDPDELYQYVRDLGLSWGIPADIVDEWVMQQVSEVLTSNYAPPAARAAFWNLLSSRTATPSVDGDIMTYTLRFVTTEPRTATVSIDSTTGWVTEYTYKADRTDDAEQDMAPADVPDVRTTYTVSIVDSLP